MFWCEKIKWRTKIDVKKFGVKKVDPYKNYFCEIRMYYIHIFVHWKIGVSSLVEKCVRTKNGLITSYMPDFLEKTELLHINV